MLNLRTPVQPSTIDDATRSVEFCIATANKVRVFDIETLTMIDEVLDPNGLLTPSAGRVPILDAHDRSSTDSILGSVDGYRVEGTNVYARLYFASDEKSMSVYQKIKEGHITYVSVGYEPKERISLNEGATQIVAGAEIVGPAQITTRWLLREVSIVAVPADINAVVREESNKALQNERKRVAEILKICSLLNDKEFEKEAIERGMSVDSVKNYVLNKLSEKTRSFSRVELVASDEDKFVERATNGLLKRAGLLRTKDAEDVKPASFLSIATEIIQRSGKNPYSLTRAEIIDYVLNKRMLTTSDFPFIMNAAITKAVSAGYQSAPTTYRAWCRIGSLPDFKTAMRVRLSDAPELVQIPEGGEVQHGTLIDEGEQIRLLSYARKIQISRQVLINDDTGVLQNLAQAIGARAGHLINSLAYNVLIRNENLSDGAPLFASTRNNIAPTGTAITDESLSAGWQMMLSQRAPQGTPLNITPRFILCSPAVYLQAAIITGSASNPSIPNNNGFNPFNSLTPIVDANIPNKRWYLAADPMMYDTVEVAFLEGNDNVTIVETQDPNFLGLSYVAYIDAAAKALDYRGLFYNPGE